MVEYVGLDVSKEATAYCVKDEKGKALARGKAASNPDALFEVLQEHCLYPERIVVETGTLSNWLARELGRRGLPVTIIDARQAHAVLRLQHNKTDENDATILAELARMGFYRAVAIKSERGQRWRILLKARAHLVAQRRSRQNVIRGLLGTLGIRFPKGSGKFARRVRAVLVEQGDLAVMFEPLVDELAALERAIKRLDRAVEAEARAEPACRLLMTVPAVGPVTALAYLATIDEAGRFAKSRALGAYLGLTSRRNQSGEMDYSGRISKQGDRLLRALLYGAANSLTGCCAPCSMAPPTAYSPGCVAPTP
jgi:transposase